MALNLWYGPQACNKLIVLQLCKPFILDCVPPSVNQVLCDNILDILRVKSQVLGNTDSIGKILLVCLFE